MKWLWWFIGIIIVVLIGWWIYSALSSSDPVPQSESVNNSISPSDAETVTNSTTTTTAADSPIQTAEAEAETTNLITQTGYAGDGTATRSYDGSTFSHTVNANIGDPASGKFYEGWLVYQTPSGPEFFSTGRLEKNAGGQFILTYTANQDYPLHNEVVITEETESLGLDGIPEAHVLEGTF